MEKVDAPIFNGITTEAFEQMCRAACMQEKIYRKNEVIFHMGDVTKKLGIVVKGSVLIENNDLWGNVSILAKANEGEVFAEIYALCGRPMMVEAVAAGESRILFLDLTVVTDRAYAGCAWHGRLLENLLWICAQKNLALSSRILCTSHKGVRGRVLAYLSEQAFYAGTMRFTLPFNRQQMADYLSVDRSALSKELGRMKKEGLIDFKKNEFYLRDFAGGRDEGKK